MNKKVEEIKKMIVEEIGIIDNSVKPRARTYSRNKTITETIASYNHILQKIDELQVRKPISVMIGC